MYKWIILGGWVALLFGGFLVVTFPNTAWNHEVSTILWFFSIILVLTTFGFCILVSARYLFKLVNRVPSPITKTSPLTHSGGQRRRRVALSFLAIIGMAVFVTGLLGFIEHEIKSSGVYEISVAEACASPEVTETLGQPVRAGWFTSGEITQSNDGRGRARLKIPLSGPLGKGILKVDAVRIRGNWQFSTLQFVATGRSFTIDLLGRLHS
jgi:hypothetical protein